MKELLAMFVLGSISLGATALDVEAVSPAKEVVYQNIEIDVLALQSEQAAKLELDRVEFQAEINGNLDKAIAAFFAK